MIPAGTFKKLMDQSLVVSNYMNQVMGTRLSEVMWLIEQVMWKSFDKRLAQFLIEESALEESNFSQKNPVFTHVFSLWKTPFS